MPLKMVEAGLFTTMNDEDVHGVLLAGSPLEVREAAGLIGEHVTVSRHTREEAERILCPDGRGIADRLRVAVAKLANAARTKPLSAERELVGELLTAVGDAVYALEEAGRTVSRPPEKEERGEECRACNAGNCERSAPPQQEEGEA